MILSDLISHIEEVAPLSLQESYDNAGLITGYPDMEINSALLSLDVTEEVIKEAIEKGCNLIISHHPLIFSGIRRLTGSTHIQRSIIKAIKSDIAIYAAHTNLDKVLGGVNSKIATKLQLQNTRILVPEKNHLFKLVTFVPKDHIENVRKAVFKAGAGKIGNYDSCSYNLEGLGSFRAGDNTNPFVGTRGKIHFEEEIRFETILQEHLKNKIVGALIKSHPYEEVAYDLYPLDNDDPITGSGMIGELESPLDETDFIKHTKEALQCKSIQYTSLLGKKVHRVAFCGGSGSQFLSNAIGAKADVYISADFKYHQFFDADKKILIIQAGHYEMEQFTKEIFYELLTKKITNFAIHFSKINTNPINYL